MRIIDYDDKKYDDWLKTIVDSRLLFCTRKELGEHIGYASLASKSFKDLLGDNLFRKKAIFHELCDEVKILTDDFFDLEVEIKCYKRASDLYRERMQLKYFIGKNEEDRKKHAKALMEYVYGSHRLPVDIPSKVEKVFKMLYDEEFDQIKIELGITYILLMVLKVLPPINDGHDVQLEKLHADYMDILSLMEEFLLEKGLDAMIDTNINMFKKKVKQLPLFNDKLNRIFLVFTVDSILDGYYTFSHDEILNETTSELINDLLWPDIDGIWCNDKRGKSGEFWKIEEVSNTYFLYHYYIKEGHRLDCYKYEMYLSDYRGNLLDDKSIVEKKKDEIFRRELYHGMIISSIKGLITKKSTNDMVCQCVCRIEHPSLSMIEFFPNNHVKWFPTKLKLYKLPKESDLYKIEDEWPKCVIRPIPVHFPGALQGPNEA